jgi:hypothetical protein
VAAVHPIHGGADDFYVHAVHVWGLWVCAEPR